MKRLLILGASGHIGGYLFRQFWEDGFTILDVSGELSPAAVEALRGLEPIVKVRVIQ